MSNYDKKMENTNCINLKGWGFDYSEVGSLVFNKVAEQIFDQLEFTAFLSESTSKPLDLIVSMPMDGNTYDTHQPRLVFDIEHQISDFISELNEFGTECAKVKASNIKRIASIRERLLQLASEAQIAINNLNNHNK